MHHIDKTFDTTPSCPGCGENLSLGAGDLVHTQQNQACVFDLVTLLKDIILIYETTIHLAEGYRLKLFY